MPLQVIRNDIAKVKADAIVNTANPEVAIGSGVDHAIYMAAGKEELLAARRKIGHLNPGEVGITKAFNLDARYIIHASCPRWNGGENGETDILRSCYEKSLKLALKHRCKSIAFPLLATGANGFPPKPVIEIAVDSFTRFLEYHEMEIFLVVFGHDSVKVSGVLGEKVKRFIDYEYASRALYRECESLDAIPHKIILEISRDSISTQLIGPSEIATDVPVPQAAPEHRKSVSLDDVITGINKDTFGKHLQKLINKKGLKNSEVYAAANITKQYFSKILKGKINPSKEKVMALAVGLRLNLDETVDFIGLAGYAFSPISQTDAVVRYFIENEEYSVMKIDIVLFDYGLDPLSD